MVATVSVICVDSCFMGLSAALLVTCTVKPVLVATSIKQATCIKRPVLRFPIMTIRINLPVLSKHLS